MQNYTLKLIMIALSILLVGCASRSSYVGDCDTLEGIQAMANVRKNRPSLWPGRRRQQVSKIRAMALQETALTLGAQAGLASRAKFIDENLTRQARNLDLLYDFNQLILQHNILPPVLLEGRNTLNLADTQTIRISDRTYKVSKQARFITTSPNWRQYLWMDYETPEYPNITLLPCGKAEKEIWCSCTEKGWKNGIDQANRILEENIARIKEDFVGMILYRKLLAMNMISPPFVSNTDLGVTGDSSEMHIDDRVLRITALPELNTNSREWVAAVAKDENALEQFTHLEKEATDAKIVITNKSWQPIINPVS